MIFSWFKRRRRRALLAAPAPPAWAEHLAQDVAFWRALPPADQARLLAIARVIDAEKQWLGGGGLEVTERMRVGISAQAALLVLNVPHDHYRNVDTIVIYPAGYQLPRTPDGAPHLAEEHVPVLGHARLRGPVVLSWRHARSGGANPSDGHNLVFHEFAHKLDMLDGVVDGTPPLRSTAQAKQWFAIMSREYKDLQREIRKGRKGLIDAYGGTNVAEFFAVATEHFFEQPKHLQRTHPRLYAVLADWYAQDPADWALPR